MSLRIKMDKILKVRTKIQSSGNMLEQWSLVREAMTKTKMRKRIRRKKTLKKSKRFLRRSHLRKKQPKKRSQMKIAKTWLMIGKRLTTNR